MKIGEYNFLGEYKDKDVNGNAITYNSGDVVSYKNQTYIASKKISGKYPILEERAGWVSLSKSQVFYQTTVAPFFAKEGDEWFDTDNGINYKRIKDSNGEHWIEI